MCTLQVGTVGTSLGFCPPPMRKFKFIFFFLGGFLALMVSRTRWLKA